LASSSVTVDPRPAIPDEAALMERIIWGHDTAEDHAKLRALLNPEREPPA